MGSIFLEYPWVIQIQSETDPRLGIKVAHVETGNDGDVCNSIITYILLKNKSEPHVIDIGVDEGWWSFFVANIQPSAIIDAFEPNPHSFKNLIPHLEKFPNIRLHNYAISDKCGFLSLTNEAGRSHSRTSLGSGPKRSESEITEVPCITIDRYIRNQHIDLVKLDTEGHDFVILNSLAPFFSNIDAIIFECTVYLSGTTKQECIDKSVKGLIQLKTVYSHMYALSRRGMPQLEDLSYLSENNLHNWCLKMYDVNYQTDILVSKVPIS